MVEDAKLREQVTVSRMFSVLIFCSGYDVLSFFLSYFLLSLVFISSPPSVQVESYNRRLREFEEQSKARSRHLAGLVSSQHSSQFPSHHHLQSDLLLEVSSCFCNISVIEGTLWKSRAISLSACLPSLLSTGSLLIGDSDTSQMFAVALSKR